ncbi:MAG: PEGA domain-containing protein, partial [Deinococcota bacterium]|nr:PEGA domain-containing protein [Deinococcota bacterium]
VYINGSEVGSVPSGTGRLSVPDLPAGSHELVVVAPGYSTVIRDFEISPGRTTEVQARQARR